MTKRSFLHSFFSPKSIAVIGATTTVGSVGSTLLQNLIQGKFPGEIFPINPKYKTLFDLPCYPSLLDVPEHIELAIIITPAKTVPALIDQCGEKKVGAVIIISAGFKELGEAGLKLEQLVIEKAAKHQIRLIGPNCLGVMNPHTQLNATFAASMAIGGNLAFISQSGAMCTAILDASLRHHLGFSAFVSIGSMADVDWADLILYLEDDPHTKSIFIYMETIGNAPAFLKAAARVCHKKPIVVIKPGRSEAAAKAAASHTGSLSGSDDVFDAAMKQTGVLRVSTIEELFDLALILGTQPLPKGPRLAILTNAGGPAVLATDAVVSSGAELASLSLKTIAALNAFLPPAWSHSNPIDLLGDASAERYQKVLEIVAKDPDIDALLVILSPQDMTDPLATATALSKAQPQLNKPLLASWMGGERVEKGIEVLRKAHIPSFSFPDNASRAFALLWKHLSHLSSLASSLPFSIKADPHREKFVQELIIKAQKEGREILTEEESKQILIAYEIPTVQTLIASTAKEAKLAAEKLGFPVVLKLHSKTITHKTDVGGVLLNLKDVKSVEEGFSLIESSVRKKAGEGHFLGVTVQKMISFSGYEVILGSNVDPQFGPVILFGSGGELVEIYKDSALALPPLTPSYIKELFSQTKIYKALQGTRGRSSADIEHLIAIVLAFTALITHHKEILECDINPLKVSSKEIIALDARIVITKTKTR